MGAKKIHKRLLLLYNRMGKVKGCFFMYTHKHPQVKLAILLKVSMFDKEGLSNITASDIIEYLELKWNKQAPERLHEAVYDVLNIQGEILITTLLKQAVVSGSKRDLSDFKELFGGK